MNVTAAVSSCSGSDCSGCTQEAAEGCAWCKAGTVQPGSCFSLETGTCSEDVILEDGGCPAVIGVDVALTNLTVLLALLVAVAIVLRVFNRVLNRRRFEKLQKSIFTLPVYVFNASTRRRTLAAREEARPQSRATTDSMQGMEEAGSPRASSASASKSRSRSSSESGDIASAFTCTICLSPYVEEEVIKVLPCGHDFHSACLDSWLAVKPMCPLCKAPAFTKPRNQDRHGDGQAQVEGFSPAAAAPPLFTSLSPNERHGSQPGGSDRSGGEVGGGLLLVRPPSPPPPVVSAPSADIDVDSSVEAGVVRSGDALGMGEIDGEARVPAKALRVGGAEDVRGALDMRLGGDTQEEMKTATSAVDDHDGGCAVESAGRGSGKGQGGGATPSGPCCPCHGSDTLGVALGDGDGEVPLDDLEGGQVGRGNAGIAVPGSE